MVNYITAIGDVSDSRCWSGIPYHFWQATKIRGWNAIPAQLDIGKHKLNRNIWNLKRLIDGRGLGGYQYSTEFLSRAEDEIFACASLKGKTVLSFHHHFPRAERIHAMGGRVIYYLDATLEAELAGHALEVRLPPLIAAEALATERANLAKADHVFTMSRWLREFLLKNAHVSPARLSVLMPGANLDLPTDWSTTEFRRPSGFRLGLVGNDWQRKGLPLLEIVARKLRDLGTPVKVIVIGKCPRSRASEDVEVVGSIDKRSELARFVATLQSCNLGCLFSEREALGISVLEFLRVGVPVAGFAHEGPADTIPVDAGLRFSAGTTAEEIAKVLRDYIHDTSRQNTFHSAAKRWACQLTWTRCIEQMEEQLSFGGIRRPVQPWLAPCEKASL